MLFSDVDKKKFCIYKAFLPPSGILKTGFFYTWVLSPVHVPGRSLGGPGGMGREASANGESKMEN